MSGRIIPTIFGKGQRFPGFRPLPMPSSFNSALKLSWHLWVCRFICWLRILIALCCVLGLCHSFKSCALPLSLLLQLGGSPGEGDPLQYSWASLVPHLVKNLPAVQETWVWSLGWGDPLENRKTTHSSILVWRIPWGCKQLGTTEWLSLHFFLFCYFVGFSDRTWGLVGS